jgi:hypothetical protein
MFTRCGGRWHVSTVMNLLDPARRKATPKFRLTSLVESLAKVAVGYARVVLIKVLGFPMFELTQGLVAVAP